MFTVRGRVIEVKPRRGGTFGVTLGPAPDLYWYVASAPPPRLGADLVLLADRVVDVKHVGKARLTVLDDVRLHPDVGKPDTPVGRVVPPVWFRRVQHAMARPLYPYQIEGAAWLASRLCIGVGSVLGDEPGVGKTGQTIAAICATQAFPAVVVAPKSLLRNWEREWSYANYEPRVAILRTRSGPMPEADVYVLTYGTLKARENDLGHLRPTTIVFDEAHALKEPRPPKYHRAAVATRLSHYVKRPILLTGTPVLNRAQEIWRLLYICDPQNWHDYEDFLARYCHAPTNGDLAAAAYQERRVITSSGRVEHLDELRALAEPYILRRLKKDVLKDLPPKTRRSLLVELHENDLTQYRAAEKNLIAWLTEQGYELQASRAKRAEAIVRLGHLRRLAGEAKLRRALPRYLRQRFASDRSPLLIFGYFRATCAGAESIAQALGLRVVSIRGSDDDDKRQAAVDAFQGGEADVFVAPIRAAGVGLTLTAAKDALFLERTWVTKELEQAEDRLHRVGATEPVTVTYLDAADTIDEDIARINAAKTKLVDALVDDKHSTGAEFAAADQVLMSFVGKVGVK